MKIFNFNKAAGWRPAIWLKMNSFTGIFQIFPLIFRDTFFLGMNACKDLEETKEETKKRFFENYFA